MVYMHHSASKFIVILCDRPRGKGPYVSKMQFEILALKAH